MSKKINISIGIIAVLAIAGLIVYHEYTKPFYPDITFPRPFKGVENAKVKIVEYSDFQCPACKAATEMVKTLDEKYGYEIKLEFKYFPLVSIHENSFAAAMAAECANDQGKFWAYHDELFAHQDSLQKSDLVSFAQNLGLDVASFTACLESNAKSKIVREDMGAGNKLGINATPTFFVDGEKVENWPELDKIVGQKLGRP